MVPNVIVVLCVSTQAVLKYDYLPLVEVAPPPVTRMGHVQKREVSIYMLLNL